jgi:hypothetical protein
MIKDFDGNKITPKQQAQRILFDKINIAIGYWEEDSLWTDGMTDKEREATRDQVKKLADRLAKVLGYVAAVGA